MVIEDEDGAEIKRSNNVNGHSVEMRCQTCSKMLARNNPADLSFEIRCPRCLNANSFYYDTDQQIYLTDSDGKILYINEQVKQITGYLPEEVLGKTPAIWGKQMPQSFYKQLWHDLLENKKPLVVNLTNRRKNGQLYEAQVRITPITNGKGKVAYFLAIQSLIKLL